eukprot:2742027-Prymnesium_polylepis.1
MLGNHVPKVTRPIRSLRAYSIEHAVLMIVAAAAVAATPASVLVVDLRGATLQQKVAALACSGLLNRNVSVAGSAYTRMNSDDDKWLADVEGGVPTPLASFLDACLRHVARGYILYNYTEQQLVLPNIVTLAGVLDAVPLEAPPDAPAPQVLDARSTLAGFSALEATQWVYDRYANHTTTMSKLNPGYDVHGDHKLNPPLTKDPQISLVDYVVKERLFNFFLVDGCVPLTKEHALMARMAGDTTNPWPRPITVY